MAKITPSALVGGIRGRIGSLVFQRRGSMTIARSQALSISNPSTLYQSAARNRLVSFMLSYRNLSAGEKALWAEYAQGLNTTLAANNGIGTTQIIPLSSNQISGSNAYVGVNTRLNQLGLNPVSTPPIDPIAGPLSIGLGLAPEGLSIPILVTLGADSAQAGDVVRVWVKPEWPGAHPYMAMTHTLEAGDITPGDPINVNFSFLNVRVGHGHHFGEVAYYLFPGKTIRFQADVISPTGAKSPNSMVYGVDEVSIPVTSNVQAIFDTTSGGYQTDLGSYRSLMSAAGIAWVGALANVEVFAIALYAYAADNPGVDLDTIDKAELELDGAPTNVADLVTAELLPGLGLIDTTGLTTEW